MSNETQIVNIPVFTNDIFTWAVTYDNGSMVTEYDEERPDGRGFLEVDQEDIARLDLFTVNDPSIMHSIGLPGGATPVFYRQRSVVFDPNTETMATNPSIHVIGWEYPYTSDNTPGMRVTLNVLENGSTVVNIETLENNE